MKVLEIQEVGPYLQRIQLEISAQKVDEVIEETFKGIANNAKLKGFRKGKISWKTVEQLPQYRNWGYEEAQRQIRETTLNDFFSEEKELDVVALSNIEEGKINKGKPVSFTLDVEVRPKPELSALSEIEVVVEKVQVEESDVLELLERERQALATLQPVEGRGVEKGDTVRIDLKVEEDGDVQREQKDVEFSFDDPDFPEVVKEKLIGTSIGKTIEVSWKAEGEVDKNFVLKVLDIQAQVAPSLDDEMAKEAGFDDLATMKQSLRTQLEKQEENVSLDRAYDSLLGQFFEKQEIPVPPVWLNNHIDVKLDNFLSQLRFPAAQAREFKRALRGGMVTESEKEIRTNIVVDHVIKSEALETTEAELNHRLEEMAKEQNKSVAFVRSSLQDKGLLSLKRQLTTEKALTWLLEKSKQQVVSLTLKERAQKIEGEKAKQMEEMQQQQEHIGHDDEEHVHDENCNHDH